jgi:ribonucleoside-diphosphate reductase alpha chain
MTARKSLPNRRAHALYNFECDGQHYIGGIGLFADGSLAEVFLNGRKVGSASEANAQDAAIIASLALQYGCPVDVLHHALNRDRSSGGPLVTLLGLVADEAKAEVDRARGGE